MGVPGLADVDLTPERIQLIGMRTATVKREAIGGDLRTVGVVAADERGLAQINTRFDGWIQKLLVSETGERVRRGQVLATIYSPEVFRAEQELLLAHGWSSAAGDTKPSHNQDDFAGGLDANARRRLELLGIATQEIDEMLRTGKPPRRSRSVHPSTDTWWARTRLLAPPSSLDPSLSKWLTSRRSG